MNLTAVAQVHEHQSLEGVALIAQTRPNPVLPQLAGKNRDVLDEVSLDGHRASAVACSTSDFTATASSSVAS